jgi:hypothetical protein
MVVIARPVAWRWTCASACWDGVIVPSRIVVFGAFIHSWSRLVIIVFVVLDGLDSHSMISSYIICGLVIILCDWIVVVIVVGITVVGIIIFRSHSSSHSCRLEPRRLLCWWGHDVVVIVVVIIIGTIVSIIATAVVVVIIVIIVIGVAVPVRVVRGIVVVVN